jgi:archaellum component FlaC
MWVSEEDTEMPTDGERITQLEGEIVLMKIDLAVAKSDIATVKDKLNKIDNNVNKLLWLVGGAIILAILKATFGGGLFQ